MNDNIPWVPNINSWPSGGASIKDCMYYVPNDKYYIYNGTNWIEAKLRAEGQDRWKILYHRSDDSDPSWFARYYDTYEDLVNFAATFWQGDQIDRLQVGIVYPEAIYTPSTGNNEENWGLLKLYLNGEYVTVGKIAPKIVFINGGTRTVPDSIFINGQQIDNGYCNNVLIYKEPPFSGFVLTYTDENDNTVVQKYTDYENLKNFMQTTSLSFKKISIIEKGVD